MRTSDFDYDLPPELIAQKPLAQRDDSRMMVVRRREKHIFHSQFRQLPAYVEKGDVLVLNNTKVIPTKVFGEKKGKEIEFLLLKEQETGVWEVLCRPARKVNKGDIIVFAPEFEGRVVEEGNGGKRLLRFSQKDILSRLKTIGFAPLPPYIKRPKKEDALQRQDLERYQTVYAKKEGAIAAPTAGLHFTPFILRQIQKKKVAIVEISLHVGLATFQPVRADRPEGHRMLEETFSISAAAARAIRKARSESRSVLAVGTTVVRALESAFQEGQLMSGSRSTSLFIYPGHEFKFVDRLLTNFHLPRSTLLMMVSAFAGHDLIMKAYREAVKEKYRFYSYGDCMLIL
ncbi:MAG: tRNA preQ1(34) S-adenosylmethionine ribosyltransferase-isomerase QueA [Candidatus Aminicenantales bacterium]